MTRIVPLHIRDLQLLETLRWRFCDRCENRNPSTVNVTLTARQTKRGCGFQNDPSGVTASENGTLSVLAAHKASPHALLEGLQTGSHQYEPSKVHGLSKIGPRHSPSGARYGASAIRRISCHHLRCLIVNSKRRTYF